MRLVLLEGEETVPSRRKRLRTFVPSRENIKHEWITQLAQSVGGISEQCNTYPA